MHIIVMIVVGIIVGVLARFFYPGAVHMGLIATGILGIAGSLLAGFAGRALHPATRDEQFHPAGFLYSILGAVVLIFFARTLHFIQ
jgi:uncharacterized membrane protein YeaQ/YmgE (transglycosylase-associated protein family)